MWEIVGASNLIGITTLEQIRKDVTNTGNGGLGTTVQRQPAWEFKMADKTKEKAWRNNLGKREFLPAVPPDGQYVLVRADSN